MDIKPSAANLAGTTNEGLLIPRVTKARVSAIPAANRVEGTQVYVTDDVVAGDSATFTSTGKGFYYYDAAAASWVKIGTGATPAPTVTMAQNSLSLNGTAVELGGTLMQPTTITTAGANNLILGGSGQTIISSNGSNAGGFGLNVQTATTHSGDFTMNNNTGDAPDFTFRNTSGNTDHVAARIWSAVGDYGLHLSGHDPV